MPGSTTDTCLELVDTSATIGVNATTTFAAQSSGAVIAEFRVRAEQPTAWVKVAYLGDSTNDGVQVLFDADGKIKYQNGVTKVDSGVTYASGTWVNFKIVANAATDTFDLWVNGTRVTGTPAAFRNALATFTQCYFGISTTTTGTAYVDDVRDLSLMQRDSISRT